MVRTTQLYIALMVVAGAVILGPCGWSGWLDSVSADQFVPRPPGVLTFNKHIAPIVFANCAGCHRPGESAPFSLLSYSDVKRRATQIAEVTENRFMPPWLPRRGLVEFAGERSLSNHQIGIIRQWVAEGAVEGEASDLPRAPTWSKGWQLGKPDLVVSMPEPFTLTADGQDVFRNFAIPVSVPSDRYVKAVEFRPGNPSIVHHAEILIDRTESSRGLDRQYPGPGFPGMKRGAGADKPGGHFVAWTPGKMPRQAPEDMAWRLHPGTDLVIQLHMLPSGKPETIQSSVGLFFTDKPPTKTPVMLKMTSMSIDIPAGERSYAIQDTYTLPVDVYLLGVYPHAHYLCRDMQGYALLPDQTKKWLIHIEQWDFNWQDDYQYASPTLLPKGTILVMRYTYDNSAENVRNPNDPPARVQFGPRSADEMGELWCQVLPRNPHDLTILRKNYALKEVDTIISGLEYMLRVIAEDVDALNTVGKEQMTQGDLRQAAAQFQRAIDLQSEFNQAERSLDFFLKRRAAFARTKKQNERPVRRGADFAAAHMNLGRLLSSLRKWDEAIGYYRQALTIEPELGNAQLHLGEALLAKGKLDEGIGHLRQALDTGADLPKVHSLLGYAFSRQGKLDEAIGHCRRAIELEPDHPKAHYQLGVDLSRKARFEEAREHLGQAGRLDARIASILKKQAWARATRTDSNDDDRKIAVLFAEVAADLTDYQDVTAIDTLAAAYAASGSFDQAISTARKAIKLASQKGDHRLMRSIGDRLELYSQSKPYHQNDRAR